MTQTKEEIPQAIKDEIKREAAKWFIGQPGADKNGLQRSLFEHLLEKGYKMCLEEYASSQPRQEWVKALEEIKKVSTGVMLKEPEDWDAVEKMQMALDKIYALAYAALTKPQSKEQ